MITILKSPRLYIKHSKCLIYIYSMRKIVHIDMDCFYAAIEMRDHPHLQGVPLAVGGSPDHRGVLSTCNYEARRFGLHSAMASSVALRQCPTLVLLPVNMAKYKQESHEISKIFQRYTSIIEPLSLDEAYLDVTNTPHCGGSATFVAQAIRQAIWEERSLTASAGIASNKFLAKIASDWNKPNGQYTIPPGQEATFAAQLELGKLPGVGKVSQQRFQSMGLYHCADLLPLSLPEMVKRFGRYGVSLFGFIRGEDPREIETHSTRKSLSVEDTFPHDIQGFQAAKEQLQTIYTEFRRRLARSGYSEELGGYRHKLFVKIKFGNFRQTTIERNFNGLNIEYFEDLLYSRYGDSTEPIRLLGLGIRWPDPEELLQTYLVFDESH